MAELPASLRGSAASVAPVGPNWRIIRDPLGVNKLFWTRGDDGGIVFAARPKVLVEQGHPFEGISAVPRGSITTLPADSADETAVQTIPLWQRSAARSLEIVAAEIRSTLNRYLAALASARDGAQFLVCLSGGLDSSGIAALAREHCSGLVAVSFDLERRRGESDDRVEAKRLAHDLNLPLVCVTSSPDSVLEKLDMVLTEGIDWRDFNVHAALVNASLAEAIAAIPTEDAKVVLTGDLANEFLADYGPEHYAGSAYYDLPRLSPGALRTVLVRGLDTSNREVGIFGAWGLPVVQPYAAAVDSYLALPADLLGSGDGKRRLGEAVFGGLLPRYAYDRPKIRAQVGSAGEDKGILALCVERGIHADYLRSRFASLHGTSLASLDRFIRAGMYRAGVPASRAGGAA